MLSRRVLLTAATVAIPGRLFAAASSLSAPKVVDVVVYGATPGGIMAAVEAASRGLKAILVGGWRETHLGGMMSGGLSRTDYLDSDAFGGRVRDFLSRVNNLRGEARVLPDSSFEHILEEARRRITGVNSVAQMLGAPPRDRFDFEPREVETVFNQLVSESGVQVYWTKGVETVARTGTRIAELSTTDGQVFRGRVFVDASYEGDLLARAGVTYEVGRGPASKDNPLDGFRGLSRDSGRVAEGQYFSGGLELDIDPFVEPGNAESGLLPNVRHWPAIAVAAADTAVQAYNFRLCMTKDPARRRDLPSTPPPGYERRNYEVLFRYLATATAGRTPLRFSDLVNLNEIGGGLYDVNNKSGFSTDALGLNWDYPDASYERREQIWKSHENYIRGFLYALTYEDDPRVSEALRAEVRTFGLAKDQFTEPHPNDTAGWPYQLYVREARRMVGDIQWSGSDLNQLDGLPLRSSKIIALASYRQDSHHAQRLAFHDRNSGRWKRWNDGELEAPSGGHDKRSPLPIEIILARRQDCTNLLVTFCVSASHQAFSAIRMELCSMALGQAAGAAASLACKTAPQPDLQDLPYDSLRELLLRGDQMMEEKFPPLWSLQMAGGFAALGIAGAGAVLFRRRLRSRA